MSYVILKGGGWNCYHKTLLTKIRDINRIEFKFNNLGFRLIRKIV